jgi:glucokinase
VTAGATEAGKYRNTAIEALQLMTHESPIAPTQPLTGRELPCAIYVVGVDIGGTNLRVALAGYDGAILGRWSASTKGARDAESVVAFIREGVDTLLADAGLPQDSLAAIAAGAPGITDTDRGVVIATSYLMGWRNVPLRDMLESEFGVPAFVDNDVNLAAIGEQSAGAAQGASDFVFLGIGTGIGAGIVLRGEVHRGSSWMSGEIGYMLVPGVSETPAGDGEPGALECIAGGEGIKTQWKSRWSEGLTTLPKEASATEIFDHALDLNPLAEEILTLAAKTLAYAIYNTSLILNSPLFILGGGVGVHPALGQATQAILRKRLAQVHPQVVHSALGADAQLVGAVFQALAMADKGLAAAAQ